SNIVLVTDSFGNVSSINLSSGQAGPQISISTGQLELNFTDGDDLNVSAVFSAINSGGQVGLQLDTNLFVLTGDLSADGAYVRYIEGAVGSFERLVANRGELAVQDGDYAVAISTDTTTGGAVPLQVAGSFVGTNSKSASASANRGNLFESNTATSFWSPNTGGGAEASVACSIAGIGSVTARLYINNVQVDSGSTNASGTISLSGSRTGGGQVKVQVTATAESSGSQPISRASGTAQAFEIVSGRYRTAISPHGYYTEDDDGNRVGLDRSVGMWHGQQYRIHSQDVSGESITLRDRNDPSIPGRALQVEFRDANGSITNHYINKP
ncbi:hypothetical protein, partial [Rubrivirga sp.]|uniref:hypothetical protein n=1 Tax=Rubrivirga sp. TaxID=1885344 RepID=UPI003C74ADE2